MDVAPKPTNPTHQDSQPPPPKPQASRPQKRRTSSRRPRLTASFTSAMASSAAACCAVRGKPSSRKRSVPSACDCGQGNGLESGRVQMCGCHGNACLWESLLWQARRCHCGQQGQHMVDKGAVPPAEVDRTPWQGAHAAKQADHHPRCASTTIQQVPLHANTRNATCSPS